jgi:alpha-1,6-mannosyltransferase
LVGIAVVYSGLIVVLCAWYWIVSSPVPDDHRGLARLWGVFALWVTPLVVAPPLFSRDVYTYGAEGELVSRGINPYTHGLQSVRGSTFYELADPLWRHAHAPYGPVFFDIARLNAHVSTSVFATLEGYRLIALLGVVVMAVSVPVLARSLGRDPVTAFALAALNPLVLLSLIGAMHNDAIMVGLLVAALALARRGHPVLGIVVCALGAQVKVPCFLGIVFIGWDWARSRASARRRAGYVGGAPPTHALVMASRAVALGVAAVIVAVLVVRTERYGMARALGFSLLAVVFLGPIVWPWYETWGLVFLALAIDVWSRRVVLVASAVACFATVPSHVTAAATEVVVAAAVLIVVVGGAGFSLARGRASVGAGAVVEGDPRHGDVDS